MREHQERMARIREEQRQRSLAKRRATYEKKKREAEKKRAQKALEKQLDERRRKNPNSKEAKEFAKTPAASTRSKAVQEPPAKRRRT